MPPPAPCCRPARVSPPPLIYSFRPAHRRTAPRVDLHGPRGLIAPRNLPAGHDLCAAKLQVAVQQVAVQQAAKLHAAPTGAPTAASIPAPHAPDTVWAAYTPLRCTAGLYPQDGAGVLHAAYSPLPGAVS
jgi:hypothetical protein